MAIKRKDFQKAAAVIHEFHLKLSEDGECAELRDALNLALLHMQRYYRVLRTRLHSQDKSNGHLLATSVRGLSPMTPFRDTPDKFQWRWVNVDNPRLNSRNMGTMPANILDSSVLPMAVGAAKQGHNDMLMQIIERDKHNLEEADPLGRTALMYAVHFGHLDSVQILLEHGIDANATADDGSTAVHRACHDGNFEALQILIEYSADLSQSDAFGRQPVHWACACKSRECLQLLIENGIDVNVRDNEGMTPSMWACRLDHIGHFELLSKAEQNISEEDGFERDNYGRTWMHWAVRRTEPLECLKTLLTEDTARLPDDFGRTVIHTAAEMGSSAAVKVIVEIGGRGVLESRDQESRTALILAAIGGHGELVNYLLAEGADLACVDNTGATAWDYARGRQLHYCMLIIASYIRQRAKYDNGVAEGTNLSMAQLQINGDDQDQTRLFKGNQPMPPPHPPQMPPSTPRTPRSRSRTPATPRSVGPPQAPSTPRLFGVKRSTNAPLGSSSEEENNSNNQKLSSGSSKRKKNEPNKEERTMSVMSIDSVDDRVDDKLDSAASGDHSQHDSQHDSQNNSKHDSHDSQHDSQHDSHNHSHNDSHNNTHDDSHDDSQHNSQHDSQHDSQHASSQLSDQDSISQEQNTVRSQPNEQQPSKTTNLQKGGNHKVEEDNEEEEPESVSIGDMDVSDLEEDANNDDDDEDDGVNEGLLTSHKQRHGSPQSPSQQFSPRQQYSPRQQPLQGPQSPHPPPSPSPRYQRQQMPSPSSQHSHPHFFPPYQFQPSPDASPTNKHPPGTYQEYTHEDYVDANQEGHEEYDEELPPHQRNTETPPHTPFAPAPDSRGVMPAHLSPLPPPSPTRRKKKKKRKDRRDIPDGWATPDNPGPGGGYAAPVAPSHQHNPQQSPQHNLHNPPQNQPRRNPQNNPAHNPQPSVRQSPNAPQPSRRKHPPNTQNQGQGHPAQGHSTQPNHPTSSGANPPLRNRSPSIESEIEERFSLDGQMKLKSSSSQSTTMPSLPGAERRSKPNNPRPVQSRAIDHSRSRPNPPPRAGSANKSKLPPSLHGDSRNHGADYLNQPATLW